MTKTVLSVGYVPDGMTPEQYKALKAKEKAENSKKNFGAGGARGFKSRSMTSFQLALERGEAKHLMPVDPEEVRKGNIALKDVPYMQRGGSWDNSDLVGKKGKGGWMKAGSGKMTAFNDGKAKKLKSNKFDYMNNQKPAVNIFGVGENLDWTGKAKKTGPKEVYQPQKSSDLSEASGGRRGGARGSGYKAPSARGGAAKAEKKRFPWQK